MRDDDLLDELLIELDIEDDEEEESIPGKVGASLPLTSPTIAVPTPPIDYRMAVTKDADKLFSFAGSKLSPVQQLYIIGLAAKGTRKGACELANVPYSVVNKWMENEEFVESMQNAVEIVRDSLEEELLKRAMEGSDRLLLEAVKASKPEKYNKKQSDINVSGNIIHTWVDLARQASVIDVGKSNYSIDGGTEE